MPEVSVIVPVYNTDKYLKRCVDSTINQTFRDFELILIDDGSTDDSCKLCDELLKHHSNIIVFHQNNTGSSSARNIGIKYSSGKYLMFCDSDDYVDSNWVLNLYSAIRINPFGYIFCGYHCVSAYNDISKISYPNIQFPSEYDLSEYYCFYKYGLGAQVWAMIFNSEIITANYLFFNPNIRIGEDVTFSAQYFSFCKKIIYIPKGLYYWVNNGVISVTRRPQPHIYDEYKTIFFARYPIINEKYKTDFCSKEFYKMFHSFEFVFDEHNKETTKEKIKFCNYILRDSAFREALKNTSNDICEKKLRLILNLRNYRVLDYFVLHYLSRKTKEK